MVQKGYPSGLGKCSDFNMYELFGRDRSVGGDEEGGFSTRGLVATDKDASTQQQMPMRQAGP